MELTSLFMKFGAALAIGVLVGLQREHAYGNREREIFAGTRTFAILSLYGCAAALLADVLGAPWVFIGLFLPPGILIIIAHFIGAWQYKEMGTTSEMAALLIVLVGALCYWDQQVIAIAVAVALTVLLAVKVEVKGFIQRVSREDIYATLRLAVITAIVLPLLPNVSFGQPPFDALNPYKIWLMVVLISSISFVGYVLMKVAGTTQGIGLSGLLGGLVSSTAVTVSFAQRSKEHPELTRPLAFGIISAWTVMFGRVLIAVAIINFALLRFLWLPLAAAGLVGIAYCVFLFVRQRSAEQSDLQLSNPFSLGPAIKFALFYSLILLATKAAQMYLGTQGIYAASLLAGLADVDAITLSMSELSRSATNLALEVAERAIVLAAMSNTMVKGAMAMVGGSKELRGVILPGFILILIAGVSVAFLI